MWLQEVVKAWFHGWYRMGDAKCWWLVVKVIFLQMLETASIEMVLYLKSAETLWYRPINTSWRERGRRAVLAAGVVGAGGWTLKADWCQCSWCWRKTYVVFLEILTVEIRDVSLIHRRKLHLGNYDWMQCHSFKTLWDYCTTHYLLDSHMGQGSTLRLSRWRACSCRELLGRRVLRRTSRWSGNPGEESCIHLPYLYRLLQCRMLHR